MSQNQFEDQLRQRFADTKVPATCSPDAVLTAAKAGLRRQHIWTAMGVALIVVVALAATALGAHLLSAQGGSGGTNPLAGPSETVSPADQTPPTLPADATVPVDTTPDHSAITVAATGLTATAGVPVIDFYTDYQCPTCATAEAKLGPGLALLVDRGQIVLRYHLMTFVDQSLNNDSSTRAAEAAACADTVGAFPAYHEALFANQPTQEGDGYTDEQLRVTIPAQAGITGAALDTFQACYDSHTMAPFVATMAATNLTIVSGTPTIMVNGQDIADGNSVCDGSMCTNVGWASVPTDPDAMLAYFQQVA
jgi:protein-disulfide isomerase